MPEPLRRIVAADSFIYDTELVSKPIPLVPGATSTSIWVTLDSLPTKDNNKSLSNLYLFVPPCHSLADFQRGWRNSFDRSIGKLWIGSCCRD